MSAENVGNASYFPEITDLVKEITEDITRSILKCGNPIIIVDNYRWIIEVLSLFAQQVSLCESCVLLLENGMEQEAYLLARSQFNNMLWIKYICDDEGEERVKEYFYQPTISQIKQNKNLIQMLTEFEGHLDERFDKEEMIEKLNTVIEENKRILLENHVENKLKSIADLAKQNALLFGSYITMYNDASKFEHSDISKTKKYRKKVVDEYTEQQVFSIDTVTSNKDEWLIVLHSSILSLFFAFDSFTSRIINRENHLFTYPLDLPAYSQGDFDDILIKFKMCMAMMEKEMGDGRQE